MHSVNPNQVKIRVNFELFSLISQYLFKLVSATSGFFITLIGTAILSGVYTLNDYFLTNTPVNYSLPTPIQQCFWVGTYCTLFCSIIIATFCVPSIMTLNLTPQPIILMYFALILASLGHS